MSAPEAAAGGGEAAPGVQGAGGGDPGAGGEAHHQHHEQAEDEHLEVGPRRGLRPPPAPLDHLVDEAAHHAALREAVQHEQHGDARQQPPRGVRGRDEARHEAREEEDGGDGEGGGGGDGEQRQQAGLRLLARQTHAGQLVTLHQVQHLGIQLSGELVIKFSF